MLENNQKIERTFKDLKDALLKMPRRLSVLTDFVLDESQSQDDRIDFLYTLARNSHPSIKFLLKTIDDRDCGLLSKAARKILETYNSGEPSNSYNNNEEALSELPTSVGYAVRKLMTLPHRSMEAKSLASNIRDTNHPAALFLLNKLGYSNQEIPFMRMKFSGLSSKP